MKGKKGEKRAVRRCRRTEEAGNEKKGKGRKSQVLFGMNAFNKLNNNNTNQPQAAAALTFPPSPILMPR